MFHFHSILFYYITFWVGRGLYQKTFHIGLNISVRKTFPRMKVVHSTSRQQSQTLRVIDAGGDRASLQEVELLLQSTCCHWEVDWSNSPGLLRVSPAHLPPRPLPNFIKFKCLAFVFSNRGHRLLSLIWPWSQHILTFPSHVPLWSLKKDAGSSKCHEGPPTCVQSDPGWAAQDNPGNRWAKPHNYPCFLGMTKPSLPASFSFNPW